MAAPEDIGQKLADRALRRNVSRAQDQGRVKNGRDVPPLNSPPPCYLKATPSLGGEARVLPIAPTLLFLGEREIDEADTAARDAAMELGAQMDRPVLLLDLSTHGDAQHAHFAAQGMLLPRPALADVPAGQAALHFFAVRHSSLFIASVAPAAVAGNERFWARQAASWPATRRRLLDLFATVVLAAPGLARSPRGLSLASMAEATVLVLRAGDDVAERADWLRRHVNEAGGRPVGMVLTGCTPAASAAVQKDRRRQRDREARLAGRW